VEKRHLACRNDDLFGNTDQDGATAHPGLVLHNCMEGTGMASVHAKDGTTQIPANTICATCKRQHKNGWFQ
jgi:hypothetical protein